MGVYTMIFGKFSKTLLMVAGIPFLMGSNWAP